MDQYYKIAKERIEYKGERYFRFNSESESVIQICLNCGECKKGKGNTIGIYVIHRMTFLTNYYGFTSYVIPCTKKEYEKQFNKVIEILK